MNNKKRALIFGIGGQDGSYLSELLLNNGYEVHGMVRRHSVSENQDTRISHLSGLIHTSYGDLLDENSVMKLVKDVQPDEIYNLAAQSQVGISFEIPKFTIEVNAVGAFNVFEACRKYAPNGRIYQASSSEMFGNTKDEDGFQRETTPMNPVSPYGCAKLFAYHLGRHYRRTYNMFISNGILFNHESVPKNTPVIIKDKNEKIDILPIEDLFRTEKHRYEGILDEYIGHSVWNGDNWTKILKGTCYKDTNKPMKLIQTRSNSYEATYDHAVFNEDNNEVQTKDLKIGDKLYKTKYPSFAKNINNDCELAEILGFIVAEGHINNEGDLRICGTDKDLLKKMATKLCNKFDGTFNIYNSGPGNFENCKNDIFQVTINIDKNLCKWIKNNIYTLRSNEKRVPKFILNSNMDVLRSFFDGYYLGDGRKSGNETYKYKGWTTSSSTLCAGLVSIIQRISPLQTPKIKCEYITENGQFIGRYYYCQLTTDQPSNKGLHLKKDMQEIISIIDTTTEDGWFYDLTTESSTFAVGPNLVKIHNSPRRGSNFVTQKVCKAAVEISLGMKDKLIMGNLDAFRDWSHAKDMVGAMHLIINYKEPRDFVISSGKTHSIREMCEYVFSKLNMDYKDYVRQDPKYMRQEELDYLCGDSSKSRNLLGWEPKYNFYQMLDEMIEAWKIKLSQETFTSLDYHQIPTRGLNN